MGMFARIRVGALQALHGRRAIAPLLLAALWLPGTALAQCALSGPNLQTLSAEPGQSVQMSFEVVQDPFAGGTCAGVTGPIAVVSDSTGGAALSDTVYSTNGPATVTFSLTAGATRGGIAEVRMTCDACSSGNQLTYFVEVSNLYQLQYVQPPAGLLQATPNATVDLSVRLLVNGSPSPGQDLVCWEITSNPAGNAVLGPGDGTCGPLPIAKGAVTGQLVGTFIQGGANGVATVPLAVGSAALAPVQVLVYPASDPTEMLVVQVATVPTLEAVTSSPIAATTGLPFDVQVRTLDITGAPSGGNAITFTSADGSITPASASVVTDANGNALASFTATQAGSFPSVITASYDPTPASPGSGDEQAVQFTVGATDPAAAGTLRKPPTDSGDLQSGAPGATLQPLAVQALDDGLPEAGVLVDWTVIEGSASVDPAQSTSDAQGLARVSVTLGNSIGTVRVQAARADNPGAMVVYTLSTVDVSQLTIVAGQDQQPQAGSIGDPLTVRFTRNGVPVAGVDIAWEVQSGDASVDPATTATDARGLASTIVSFGPEGGDVLVRASAPDTQPVSFRFSVPGGSGPPPQGLSLAAESGDGQIGVVGTRADQPLVVIARDANGDPVAGLPVGWRVLSGSAELDATESVTDAGGRASIGLRFDDTSGPVEIRASAYSDLAFADFDARAFAPGLSIVSGDAQQAQPGAPLADELVVAISAPEGVSLDGVPVTWSVLDGDGSLQSITTLTDTSGQARNRLTLGPQEGAQLVRAEVAGGSAVQFTATGVAGGGELVKVSGDNQTLATSADSAPMIVELRDASGNPVAGATLSWTADNAELAQASTVTDAEGRSSNRAAVVLPGAASISVAAENDPDAAAVFVLNGGVVNTSGLDPGQREVAEAIDNLCPALAALPDRSAAQQDLLERCMELADNAGDDPAGVADALDELLQDVAMIQVHAALMITSAQFENLQARIAAIRSGERGFSIAGLNVAASGGAMPLSLLQEDDAGEVGADFGRWGFFASGTIGRGEADGMGMTRYDYDTAGLTAGVDYRFSDRWIAGAALGYARQDTELANDEGEVGTNGWSVSAYSTWFNANSWYADAVVTYGSSDYELARRIRYTLQGADGSMASIDQLASADSDGSQVAAALSFGRDFQRGAWSLGPYLRGTFTQVSFDDYSEALREDLPGAGLGLSVDARDVQSVTAVLGGKATYAMSRDWGILMPHLSVEWEHEFEDDAQALVARFLHDPTQTPINVSGNELDTDYFNVGFGLSAVLAGGRSGFVFYERLLGAEGRSHGNLAIGIRIEF